MTPLSEGSSEPLAQRYDTALVDLDGVVYIGPEVVPGAAESLARARQAGMRVAFVTNNAARTPEAVAVHLRDLGVAAEPGDVVTSAQAAATLVAEQVAAGAPVLVVGGEGLRAALTERGLRPVQSADDAPAAVVQGFAPEVGWALLTEGAIAVRRGLPWVASNLDRTIPTARGLAPGNGALVGVIAAVTGATPLVAGKPELALHQEAMRRIGAQRPLVVGDRLDTDIEGANRAGVDSLLVLTGVTSPSEMVCSAAPLRPSYIAEDLASGLLEAHRSVQEQDGEWSCGGWTAKHAAAAWRIEGAGPRIDALRALCAGVWAQGQDGAAAASMAAALDGLPER
ncbi:MAG: HAD-IIA family hydrolase [Sporichthyaceae bacterium]